MGHNIGMQSEAAEVSVALLGERADLPNYYEILDVHQLASRLEIREAYLQLKSTYGAGSAAIYSLMSEDEAREQLAMVEAAFKVLGDDVERRAYDLKMGFEQRTGRDSLPRYKDSEVSSLDIGTERILRSREQSQEMANSLAPSPMDGTRLSALVDGLMATAEPGGEWSAGLDPSSLSEPLTVRTTRSTLPIVQLKATQAGSEKLLKAYAALREAHSLGDGELFRSMREAAGVTETEMQERIKVSLAYLRAIEANEFDRLPQVVYVKGFLRGYFRYLAVPDAETLVAAFAERLQDWQAHRRV